MNLWGFISAAVLLIFDAGTGYTFCDYTEYHPGTKGRDGLCRRIVYRLDRSCNGCQSGCFDFADEFSCSFYDVEVCRCCLICCILE